MSLFIPPVLLRLHTTSQPPAAHCAAARRRVRDSLVERERRRRRRRAPARRVESLTPRAALRAALSQGPPPLRGGLPLAEGEGFEPPVSLRPRRFSKPLL